MSNQQYLFSVYVKGHLGISTIAMNISLLFSNAPPLETPIVVAANTLGRRDVGLAGNLVQPLK
jgi:hypothetical protein